jgi:S-adenosylmethionine hydrolase
VRLESPAHRRPAVSATIHGRDVFAPAAAHLAAGTPLERLGPAVPDPVMLPVPGWRLEAHGAVAGEVIGWDRFGNLLTSITTEGIAALGPGPVALDVGGRPAGGLVGCYAEVPAGDAGGVVGSTGRLEVFVNRGSARALLRATRGMPVRARRGATGSPRGPAGRGTGR